MASWIFVATVLLKQGLEVSDLYEFVAMLAIYKTIKIIHRFTLLLLLSIIICKLSTQLMVHDLGHLAVVTLSNSTLIDIIMLFKQSLKRLVGVHVVFFQAEDVEGLLLCDESSLDS